MIISQWHWAIMWSSVLTTKSSNPYLLSLSHSLKCLLTFKKICRALVTKVSNPSQNCAVLWLCGSLGTLKTWNKAPIFSLYKPMRLTMVCHWCVFCVVSHCRKCAYFSVTLDRYIASMCAGVRAYCSALCDKCTKHIFPFCEIVL